MTNITTNTPNKIERDQEIQIIGNLGFVLAVMKKSQENTTAPRREEPFYVVDRSEAMKTAIVVNPKFSKAVKIEGKDTTSLCQISFLKNEAIQINLQKIEGIDKPVEIIVQEGGKVQCLGQDVSEDLEHYARMVAKKGIPTARAANDLAL